MSTTEKAGTRNLKSDHIFACILHSKNRLSCKYNDFRSHLAIPLFYYHDCSMTTAVRSVKFPFLSHSYHYQPWIPTKTPDLGKWWGGRDLQRFSRAAQAGALSVCLSPAEGCLSVPAGCAGAGHHLLVRWGTAGAPALHPLLILPFLPFSAFTPISFPIPSLKLRAQ